MGDKCKTKTATMSKKSKTKTAVTSKKRRLKVLPFVLVKTKTEDGGSPVAYSTVRKEGRDAFLHYSNNTVRMRHLLGLKEAEQANQDIQEDHLDAGGQADKGTSRNTRLSFELHDSAFYEEWFGMPRQE